MSRKSIDRFINQTLKLAPAAAGASGMQQDYRRFLLVLGVLVALVLLIACSNVANLMTVQAAARVREMALRVSIGAGRWRLVQLVMVESAILAFLAAAMGGAFAWWSAPYVVSRIDSPGNPVRLSLPMDWRVAGFGLALTVGVTILFGLAPALRASSIRPASALKGGSDPSSRRRLMHALVAAQVAFCFLVIFVAGLFAATFERLANRPIGFSAERLLALNTMAQRAQPAVFWDQVAEHLRAVPGVEAVALADRPMLDGYGSNSFISVNGAPPSEVLAYFRSVSSGWLGAMKVPLIDGRDFGANDLSPGTAIVNEAFAKQYFHGENPIGMSFERTARRHRYQVVGLVRDAPYRSMREAILPVAFVPFHALDAKGAAQLTREATFMVRTSSANPLALASTLRREVPQARSEFRAANIRTQLEINQAHTIRERLLAMLALFFATVALMLAGIGLYGVLDYSVLQRRREIGIRVAIGAQTVDIARRVTSDVFRMVLLGALAGVALGMASVRYIAALLYEVKPTDLSMLVVPSVTILAAALLAALPAVLRAVRIDPVSMLRAD
jgi:predicted permease